MSVGEPDGGRVPVLRPQSIMLALLGGHVLGRGVCVYSGSFIDVLARVGVSEQAVRSTLTRMVDRDLLRRRRQGRRMYFGLTPRCEAVLDDGGRRIRATGEAGSEPGETWTLVGFSLPDALRRERHDLRARLAWAGFGMLHSGLWIAPSRVDVGGILTELGVGRHVKVFEARPVHPADLGPMIRDAYDLEGLAEGYRAFLGRWDRQEPLPGLPDDLARELTLMAEWLRAIRRDPRLPLTLLPGDWPAPRAQRVFRETRARLEGPARRLAADALDTVPAG